MAWTPRSDTGGGNWSVFYRVLARRATKAAAQEQAERPGATLTVTLEELGISAQGILVVASPIAYGTLSQSLENLTVGGTGGIILAGAVGATLGTLSATGSARLRISGSTSASLGAATVVSTSTLRLSGSASITLGAVTLTTAGTSITAPVITRTSSAGASPLLFTATLNTSDTFAGYTFRVQVAANTSSDFTTTTQDILHTLTESDVTSGDIDITSDGFTTPSGAYSLRVRIERDDGVVSPWSNVLTDTISASTAKLTSTTGTLKNSLVTLSNLNYSETGQVGAGNYLPVGASIDTTNSSGKFYFEVTVTSVGSISTTLDLGVGICNGSTCAMNTTGTPGVNDATGICFKIPIGGGSTSGFWNTNNDGSPSGSMTWTGGNVAGDVFGFNVDRSGSAGTHTITVYRYRASDNGGLPRTIGTATGLTLTTWSRAFLATKSDHTLTFNPGNATFVAHTLTGTETMYG